MAQVRYVSYFIYVSYVCYGQFCQLWLLCHFNFLIPLISFCPVVFSKDLGHLRGRSVSVHHVPPQSTQVSFHKVINFDDTLHSVPPVILKM